MKKIMRLFYSFIHHQAEQLNVKLQELKQKLASGTQNLPYTICSEELLKIENIGKKLKEIARGSLRYDIAFQIF
jgi:hypothetical protein